MISHGVVVAEEYLTIEQLAARLSVKPKTIRNKMANGIFRKGEHFYSPQGLGPRFKWSAVKAWLESEAPPGGADEAIDAMARGYVLRTRPVEH